MNENPPETIDNYWLLYHFDVQQLPYAEIMEMYGLTKTALANRLNRLRNKIAAGEALSLEAHFAAQGVEKPDTDIQVIEEAIRAIQQLQARYDPVITHYHHTIKTGKPIAILLAGCMQIGGRWTYHSMIREKLEQMLSCPGIYMGQFGDEIENFQARSFAGERSVFDQAIEPRLQRILWDKWLDRVEGLTLWAVGSQHGTIWDERVKGFAPLKYTYVDRGIPFFDGQSYYKLTVGTEDYNLAIAHEFPGSSIYNPNHPQGRALWQRYPNADVVAMADKHQYSVQERQVYGPEVLAGNRPSPYVYLIQIGTAKGGPDPYTIRGWERGQTEWPWLVLWPDQHLMKVTRHFDDVRLWLE